jgi:hypothetical protein
MTKNTLKDVRKIKFVKNFFIGFPKIFLLNIFTCQYMLYHICDDSHEFVR